MEQCNCDCCKQWLTHTQRQRDEGYNEARQAFYGKLLEYAEMAEGSCPGADIAAQHAKAFRNMAVDIETGAILALRRQT